MKKLIIAVLVLVVLGGIVFASLRAGGGEKGTKVYAEPAARHAIGQVVKASGEIDPRIKVNISAHVVGKITRLYVREGERIEKGKPFLELEKQAFQAERDRWSAQLRQAQTQVQQAQLSLADARHKLERAQRLHAEGVTAVDQLEAAQLAETSARLQLDDAGQSVNSSRANLAKALDDLAKTTIFSPLSGRVVSLKAEEGEVVIPGTMNNSASVIGTIADLSEILARVDVDETEIVSVHVGQPASIKVDALPNHAYHGHVVEVGSSGFNRPAQPDVTFFEVKILLDETSEDLRPGMSVRAEIETRPAASALVVPIQSVVERTKKPDAKAEPVKVVFVLADGKGHQREVTTGISDETRVEILSGLKPDETVITGPYRSLRDLKDGDAVYVTTPEKEDSKDSKKKEDKD